MLHLLWFTVPHLYSTFPSIAVLCRVEKAKKFHSYCHRNHKIEKSNFAFTQNKEFSRLYTSGCCTISLFCQRSLLHTIWPTHQAQASISKPFTLSKSFKVSISYAYYIKY